MDPIQSTASPPLATELADLAAFVRSCGAEFDPAADRLDALLSRLDEGSFHLAVLGQFKRGKSTLLNALLGEAVLPSSVVPLTAIPTRIRGGPARQVRIAFTDGRADEVPPVPGAAELAAVLARYVTEEANPANRLGVRDVEVLHPSPALSHGVVLIDTPGIGSTYAHNTATTMAFLAECDAALFLVSADPPITAVEVEFLREVRGRVPRLFFLLNKVDYLADDEAVAVTAFLRRVLTEQVGLPAGNPIYPVSARRGLAARERGDMAEWRASGCAEVADRLLVFLAEEKQQVLEASVRQRALELAGEVLLALRLSLRALAMPIEELEEKSARFDAALAEAEQQRRYAKDMLVGEQKRMAELVETQAATLRERYGARLVEVADAALAASGSEAAAVEAMAGAVAEEFPLELEATAAMLDEELGRRLRVHHENAARLIGSVRTAAAELFDVPYRVPETEHRLEPRSRAWWVRRDFSMAPLIPIPAEVMERALPRRLRERRAKERLGQQAGNLVKANVENLRWSMVQDLDAAFRAFAAELDEGLADAVRATHGAIAAAVAARRRHEEESRDLAALRGQEVAALEEALARLGVRIDRGAVPLP